MQQIDCISAKLTDKDVNKSINQRVNSELQRLSCCDCISHIEFLLFFYRHCPDGILQLSIESSNMFVGTPCSLTVINKCVSRIDGRFAARASTRLQGQLVSRSNARARKKKPFEIMHELHSNVCVCVCDNKNFPCFMFRVIKKQLSKCLGE